MRMLVQGESNTEHNNVNINDITLVLPEMCKLQIH